MWSGTPPDAMWSPQSPGGATRYRDTFCETSPVPDLHVLSFFLVGGQRLLAVDIPGSPSSEEQQGPLLPTALETPTPEPARCRRGQGRIFIDQVFFFSPCISCDHNCTGVSSVY